jgi:hypothetical protein
MVFFDQLKKPTFTVILAVMLKSAIFDAEKFDVPHDAPK